MGYNDNGDTMILISNIKIPAEANQTAELERKIQGKLNKKKPKWSIRRRSLDARGDVPKYVYQILVDAALSDLRRKHDKDCTLFEEVPYLPQPTRSLLRRPIIVGTGPAGLFAGYLLAKFGARPILLERGRDVERRTKDVEHFWSTGELLLNSNVQFGEGGAGTFSDGKLMTRTKDPRVGEVLRLFAEHGAPKEICYVHNPHIGTDRLREVVKALRKSIENFGGEFRFEERMSEVLIRENRLLGIRTDRAEYDADVLVLALGNAARDTFRMLFEKDVPMEAKPLAMGFRIEHAQSEINRVQYGATCDIPSIGAAEYRLTHRSTSGIGVYTFCTCPGGAVVAASSEPNRLCVNGMSYYARDLENANSAVVANVSPKLGHPLEMLELQESVEEAAFLLGGGNFSAPVQRVSDFLAGRKSTSLGSVRPAYRPSTTPTDLSSLYPEELTNALRESLLAMDSKLPGFAAEDAVLTGVETRTSSPVRILRGEDMMSLGASGLYPVGEGAGYAGGITSSAVDGLKAAEKILRCVNIPSSVL